MLQDSPRGQVRRLDASITDLYQVLSGTSILPCPPPRKVSGQAACRGDLGQRWSIGQLGAGVNPQAVVQGQTKGQGVL